MPLRVIIDRDGRCRIAGQRKDFTKYEKDVISGKIPSPFTVVEFKDTEYRAHCDEYLIKYSVVREGRVLFTGPIPLTPEGDPKVRLFQ